MNYGQTAYAVDSEDVESSPQKKKVKKPGFIKRWILNSVKDVMMEEQNRDQLINNSVMRKQTRGLDMPNASLDSTPMHMKVYRASGGTIVETTIYDRQKDRSQHQLHIITHDADLGQGLAKIITMESLRG